MLAKKLVNHIYYATHSMVTVHEHKDHNAWQTFDGVDHCEYCDMTIAQAFYTPCPGKAADTTLSTEGGK